MTDSSQEGHESHENANLVLFVILSLVISFIGYELRKLFRIPVAPILLALGLVFKVGGSYVYIIQNAVGIVETIDPHVINLAILPPLVFEAALATDWYTFRKELGQIIPMATTMVFISSFMAAGAIKYVLGYDFTWDEAILMGVILSATDHVAVVAQLKEIYASDRLETLISGETLLNEAVVIMLFKLLHSRCLGVENEEPGTFMFLRLSIGGILLGLTFSLIMAWAIKQMINDIVQETGLTIIGTYLIFFIADGTEVETSGALAVVTFGLFMSAYGKTLISPSIEKSLHDFWKIFSTNIEALVFIIGGMLLGMFSTHNEGLEVGDFMKFLIMFVLLHVIRAIVVFLHYPVFKYFGYGITIKELLVIILAGLKGVISITLALIVYHDEHLNHHFRLIVLFFTVLTAGFSIIIDSFAVKTAVRKLGLEDLTDVQENMLVGVTTAILEKTAKDIEKYKGDKNYSLVRWQQVAGLSGSHALINQILKSTKAGSKLISKFPKDEPDQLLKRYLEEFKLDQNSLLFETRRRYLTTLKRLYWHEFEAGNCLGFTSLILIDSTNTALDREFEHMEDWLILERNVYNHTIIKFYSKCSRMPIFGKYFKKALYENIKIAYDASRSFIKVHHEAEELMDQMEVDIDKEIFEEVMKEAHAQVFHCKEFVKAHILDVFPEIIAEVQTFEVCNSLLSSQKKLIKKIYHQGLIQEVEYENLAHTIDRNIKSLSKNREIPTLPNISTTLKNRFMGASEEVIQELLPKIEIKSFSADEPLFTEGTESNGAFLIINGRVREQSSWIDQELIIGNIVGVQHLLPLYQTHLSTATALTAVEAALLPNELMSNPLFMLDLYKEAVEEIVLLNKETFRITKARDEHIMKCLSHSEIRFFKAFEAISLSSGGFLLYGKIKRKSAFRYIRPDSEPSIANEDSIFLSFPKEIGQSLSQNQSIEEALAEFYSQSMRTTKTLKIETGAKMLESFRNTSRFSALI